MQRHAFRLSFVAVSLFTLATAANADSLTIQFSDLSTYAESKSIRARIIAGSLGLVKAERDIDLQSSNPEFAFDRQDVDGSQESQFTLGKSFEMPWITLKRRSGWADRVRSAEYGSDEQRANLLSELKAGYISIKLLEEQASRLGHLREVLTSASQASTTRHSEGHLSGIEDHMIQMVVISLHAEHQSLVERRREISGRWLALMGIDEGQLITLRTPIAFQTVALEPFTDYVASVTNRPGYQSRLLLQMYLQKLAGAENLKLLPSFSLYGGIKKIEPDYNGYVVGFSIGIPLLNFNRAATRKLEIERQMISVDTERYRIERSRRLESLALSIRESQGTLAPSAAHFQEDAEKLDNILFAYEEGQLTLSELLNAIQIEIAGLSDYYDHLTRYYTNIFELEAISGTTLVTFE